MSDKITPSRTATYEHTVNGLLRKRYELFNEATHIRDRLAEISNDIGAIDRVLAALGYTGDLDDEMPIQKRQVMFGYGELTRAVLEVLRDAPEPMLTRQIARSILAANEQDPRDRRVLTEVVRRVGNALRVLRRRGHVASASNRDGEMVWSVARGQAYGA